jgi:hypothetical protein
LADVVGLRTGAAKEPVEKCDVGDLRAQPRTVARSTNIRFCIGRFLPAATFFTSDTFFSTVR